MKMRGAEAAARSDWRGKTGREERKRNRDGGLVSSAVSVLSVLQEINFLPVTTELDSFGLPSRETVL